MLERARTRRLGGSSPLSARFTSLGFLEPGRTFVLADRYEYRGSVNTACVAGEGLTIPAPAARIFPSAGRDPLPSGPSCVRGGARGAAQDGPLSSDRTEGGRTMLDFIHYDLGQQ